MQGRSRLTTGAIVALGLGNALAFYDLVVFGVFAVQIGRAIFPSGDPAVQLLLTLGTFGLGFLSRPVGAVFIGRYADRAGRKPAMILSFSLAGAAVLGQALVPSYTSIGMAAPALMLLFRLILGFAIGGEIGPTTAYLVEAAPPLKRGLVVSISFATQDAGVLFAGIVGFLLANNLSDAALVGWGWRVAMLIGILVIPFGLLVRSRLEETLSHDDPHVAGQPVYGQTIRRIAILGMLMIGAGTVGNYGLTFLNIYAQTTLNLHASTAFGSTIAFGIAAVSFDLVGGLAADRFGRRRTMMTGSAVLGASLIPGFWLINAYPGLGILAAVSFWLSAWNVIGPSAALTGLAEALPMRMRSTGFAITYSLAVAILGGSTEAVVAWLTHSTGDPMAPAYYILAFALVGFLSAYAFPETAPRLLAKEKDRGGAGQGR